MLFVNGEHVGVAAKRLSSTSKLTVRLTEGIKQIEKAGLRGFVALNLDVFVKDAALDSDPEQRGDQYNQYISDLHRNIEKYRDRNALMGIFNFGTLARWETDGDRPRLGIHWFTQHWWQPDSDDQQVKGEMFFDRLFRLIDERLLTL
jgi:hypothetical protein